MRYVSVKIRRDVNTVYNRAVPEWEIPVLEQVFGDDGNVEVLAEHTPVDREYPDPEVEAQRLVRRYGEDVSTKVSYFHAAYGGGRVGVNRLRTAIADAEKAEAAATPKGAKKAKASPAPKRRGRPRAEEVDSLLS
jgi:hypothetical protein